MLRELTSEEVLAHADRPLTRSGIDANRNCLTARETVHVARNVTDEMVGPMAGELKSFRDMLCRLVGDPPDSDMPAELRSKGLISEMREGQEAFQAEQRKWKEEDDAAKAAAADERKDIIVRVERLEREGHKVRRLVVWFIRWCTKKDDAASIAIGKIILVVSSLCTVGVASWKGMSFIGHQLYRLLTLIFR